MPGRWREDLPGSPWRWLLAPAWCAFAPAAEIRRIAYDRGWLAVHRLPAPVISVGNLTAGGTGKTPATRLVAELLRELGRKPAVVSRGYRGSDGVNEEAALVGDVPVVCDPDRVRGGRTALAGGADCLVLDDGFQHRRLFRDLDVVLLDATRPFGADDGGDGALLPLGYRRETLPALARAGLVWISRADVVEPERLAALHARLDRLLPSGTPRVVSRTGTIRLERLPSDSQKAEGRAVDPRQGQRPVVLASGIGHPAAFETIAGRQLRVLASRRFPDHHHFTAAEAAELAAWAQKHQADLVVTSKDAVKLKPFAASNAMTWILHAEPDLDRSDREQVRSALASAIG
ncbi:tetraacyldisaccharide 4'-kinase [Planctomycetota bacterium]|nr:tetraacyldisaccharide 4'-kinase [Planctomycetota bacterium]